VKTNVHILVNVIVYSLEQRNEHQKHFTIEQRGVTSHCLRNRSNLWQRDQQSRVLSRW